MADESGWREKGGRFTKGHGFGPLGGRPALSDAERRSAKLNTRLCMSEAEWVVARARAKGMRPSSYLRGLVLAEMKRRAARAKAAQQ